MSIRLSSAGGGGAVDLSGYVPYTGATADVDLGLFDLTATDVTLTGLLNLPDTTATVGQIVLNSNVVFHAFGGTQSYYIGGAGRLVTTSGADYNIGIGVTALDALTSGDYIIGIGYGAGSAATSGSYGIFIGYNAGLLVSTKSNVIAIGREALVTFTNVAGTNVPLAIGAYALNACTRDTCMGIGYEAGKLNSTGSFNCYIGFQAGKNNLTGLGNLYVGANAGQNNLGAQNVALGRSALTSIVGAVNNNCIAIGEQSLTQAGNASAVTNNGHIAIGISVMPDLYSGINNLGVGANALTLLTWGTGNTAVGGYALQSLYGDDGSTPGYEAEYNTGVGYSSLNNLAYGINNVAIGYSAGYNISSGDGNMCLGYFTGPSTGMACSNRLYMHNNTSDTPLIYGEFDNLVLKFNADVTIGVGTAGKDYVLTFDGETNDGVITWMEDEDYLKFSDDILVDSTEKIYFRDTAISISSVDDGHLDLMADVSIDLNTAADTDLILNFFGTSNSGVLTWMEDEDYFDFADAIATSAIKLKSSTPSTLGGDVNNWDLGNFSFIRAAGGTADRIVTGIVAQSNGHVLFITNVGTTNKLSFANESASSSAANRIMTSTAGTVEIPAAHSIQLIYDSTSARWRELSHS